MKRIYLDNASNFSYKENLNKEPTFLKKVQSKTRALSRNKLKENEKNIFR